MPQHLIHWSTVRVLPDLLRLIVPFVDRPRADRPSDMVHREGFGHGAAAVAPNELVGCCWLLKRVGWWPDAGRGQDVQQNKVENGKQHGKAI